ncbi:MAG: class I tRNA ligase family protein, partial [Traorella sp.]
TWFSSALWPFSTLGWPDETDDFKRYYPNDTLVTGYDIIFFWVARMAFQARYATHSRPFKDVLIHGLIRDAEGKKMSKSLGNGVDPMDVIEKYGCDTLRFFLTTNSTPGQDLRFITDKVESSWNFINKIWNASRFVNMYIDEDLTLEDIDLSHLSITDKWIIDRFNTTLKSVTMNMDRYEFALVGNELYNFIWDDFCSWYIELSKASLNGNEKTAKKATVSTLITVLRGIVILLHPFMPFVTEEIYSILPRNFESINQEVWPQAIDVQLSDTESEQVSQLITMIQAVREIKTQYNLKPSEEVDVMIKDVDGNLLLSNPEIKAILYRMCKATWLNEKVDGETVSHTILKGTLEILLADVINIEEEIAKNEKELVKLSNEIKRCENMLSNPNFVNKAPESKVNAEKDKLAHYREQYDLTQIQLNKLKQM